MAEPNKPKPKSTINPKVTQRQVSDTGRLSHEIPDAVKVSMAGAIMAFSQMDMSAEIFIWELLGLSQEDGKLLTQMESKERFELAKKLSDRYGIPIHANEQSNVEAWSLIRIITEARNKMAHGAWSMLDGSIPLVVSFRIPAEPGTINSEHFPIDRMDAMQTSCWQLKKAFDVMATAARSSPRKPTPQGPESPPGHPEHPIGGGR